MQHDSLQRSYLITAKWKYVLPFSLFTKPFLLLFLQSCLSRKLFVCQIKTFISAQINFRTNKKYSERVFTTLCPNEDTFLGNNALIEALRVRSGSTGRKSPRRRILAVDCGRGRTTGYFLLMPICSRIDV